MTLHVPSSDSPALRSACLCAVGAVLALGALACDGDVSDPGDHPRVDTVSVFSRARHAIDFESGTNTRTLEAVATMPASLDGYERIEMWIGLECPAEGCDPWDRFAAFTLVSGDEEIELGRYITPYGIGCTWRIDVTDFRERLTGAVRLRSFIDTWVKTGWLLTARFLLFEGTPTATDVHVDQLWMDWDVVYGDPARPPLQPDLSFTLDLGADSVKARLLVTGHGQGNTGNAAEFLPQSHALLVNGTPRLDHMLWRTDCPLNPCSPQFGNWSAPRAGWCPGAAVPPVVVNLTPFVVRGAASTIEYRLGDYENLCRPDNPFCVPGAGGCASCAYDGGAHTEPHYKIALQVVTYR